MDGFSKCVVRRALSPWKSTFHWLAVRVSQALIVVSVPSCILIIYAWADSDSFGKAVSVAVFFSAFLIGLAGFLPLLACFFVFLRQRKLWVSEWVQRLEEKEEERNLRNDVMDGERSGSDAPVEQIQEARVVIESAPLPPPASVVSVEEVKVAVPSGLSMSFPVRNLEAIRLSDVVKDELKAVIHRRMVAHLGTEDVRFAVSSGAPNSPLDAAKVVGRIGLPRGEGHETVWQMKVTANSYKEKLTGRSWEEFRTSLQHELNTIPAVTAVKEVPEHLVVVGQSSVAILAKAPAPARGSVQPPPPNPPAMPNADGSLSILPSPRNPRQGQPLVAAPNNDRFQPPGFVGTPRNLSAPGQSSHVPAENPVAARFLGSRPPQMSTDTLSRDGVRPWASVESEGPQWAMVRGEGEANWTRDRSRASTPAD